jgi:predicted lipoprotein with Yx(FWY)xxD motif
VSRPNRRLQRRLALPAAAVAGLTVVVVVAVATAAAQTTPTLQVAKGAEVSSALGSTATETIVVNGRGRAVYDLSGDSARHPKCTGANGCFAFWPPVTVSSARGARKAGGVSGRLGTWRHGGIIQLTLNGHPLYTFLNDHHADAAIGEGIHGFNGVWHVLRIAGTPVTSVPITSAPTTTTSTTTTCLYPPCY